MAWDFEHIVSFAREFMASGREGHELAFVFSEWTPENGLAVVEAYPVTRTSIPPTDELPPSAVSRIWVDVGSGWQQINTIPAVRRVGMGESGVVQSGVESSMIIAGWPAKGIAAGYILAPSATMGAINAGRNTAIAIMRVKVNEADIDHPLEPESPFTSQQVTYLAAWLNAHGVTNSEFAALFGVTAAQLGAWLTSHPRWQFAQVIHDRFA